jgi:hypothetical protein
MRLSSDPGAKAILKQLRDLWIQFANEAGVSQSARGGERVFIDMDQNQRGNLETL